MIMTIVTPVSSRTENILWLEITTPVGNMVIQPGHAPMVLELAPNKPIIFSLPSGKRESIIAGKGIVEVSRTSAAIILHDAPSSP